MGRQSRYVPIQKVCLLVIELEEENIMPLYFYNVFDLLVLLDMKSRLYSELTIYVLV